MHELDSAVGEVVGQELIMNVGADSDLSSKRTLLTSSSYFRRLIDCVVWSEPAGIYYCTNVSPLKYPKAAYSRPTSQSWPC